MLPCTRQVIIPISHIPSWRGRERTDC